MRFNEKCVLTNYSGKGIEVLRADTIVEYKFDPIGIARIGLQTYISFYNDPKPRPVLAGVCRNRFENGEEPILLTQEFLDSGIKNYDYPKDFAEKTHHLMKHLYNMGGKDNKQFDLHSSLDYPLCYANDDDEFERIVDRLYERGLITYYGKPDGSGRYYVKLQEKGVEEVKKGLPKMPLVGLVVQEISTGDTRIDKRINHAKDLFFSEPVTMDNLRSACEALSNVLEPIREELKTVFSKADVQDFFNIVNNFDVRHNKEHTKQIEHPEQLEWVFYSLLNTINTYAKIKQKQNL